MPGLYVNDGGVTRKLKKLYTNVDGVTRELKELWVRDSGGVSRKIFRSGVRAKIRQGFAQFGGTFSWDSRGAGRLILPSSSGNNAMSSIEYDFDDPIHISEPVIIRIEYDLNHNINKSQVTAYLTSYGLWQKGNGFSAGEHSLDMTGTFVNDYITGISISVGYTKGYDEDTVLRWDAGAIKIIVGSDSMPISDVYQ